MMRPYNKQLNTDINNLKKLHVKKDKTDFNKAKAEIMKRHNISKATVYREMKKDTPGLYKRPQYYPPVRPVTEREKRMVNELLHKGTKIQDIQLIMENETGERYSWDRVDMIREELEKDTLTLPKESFRTQPLSQRARGENPEKQGKIDISRCSNNCSPLLPGEGLGVRSEIESGFGDDIKLVLTRILNFDKISPNSYLSLNVKGVEIILGHQALNDILMILANSTDAGMNSMIELSGIRLRHIIHEKTRLVYNGLTTSIRDIKELSDLITRYEKTASQSFTPNHKVLTAVVKEFAPGASDVMIFISAQKHQKEIAGSTEDIIPDIRPIKALAVEEMTKNM
jgi:transposase